MSAKQSPKSAPGPVGAPKDNKNRAIYRDTEGNPLPTVRLDCRVPAAVSHKLALYLALTGNSAGEFLTALIGSLPDPAPAVRMQGATLHQILAVLARADTEQ